MSTRRRLAASSTRSPHLSPPSGPRLGALALAAFLSLAGAAHAAGPSLKLDKTEYLPNEEIHVTFSAPASYPDDAWIGPVPSKVPHGSEKANDENKATYEYLHQRTSGVVTFNAPVEAGSWDIRMNDRDDDGKEVASVSFRVAAPSARATVQLPRTRFIAGEPIAVQFTVSGQLPDNAWLGVVPSKVPHGSEKTNDENDLEYEYLHKRTSGSVELRAPVEPGSYDVRLNDSDDDGREIASATFQVSVEVTAQEMAQQIARTGKVALYGIRFDTGKADIRPDAAPVLAQVGQLLASQPALRLRVEGHTDDVGDDAANLQLSQRRAEAVKAYLVSRLHVDAARLDARGFGETRAVADNKTPSGRAQNRRVELVKE